MVNYENGKIYKIVCNETGLIYIGSTAQKYLSTRLGEHKKTHKSYLNGKSHYVSSFEVLEGGNFDIILLENYYCKDKYELKAKERHYIETIKCVNKYIPNRTNKEYRDTNKDYLKEYRSTYYENNKDKIIQTTRQYKEANKDIIKMKNQHYREDNKDKINAKVKCICGCEVLKRELKRHEQTKKHINLT